MEVKNDEIYKKYKGVREGAVEGTAMTRFTP